MKCPHCNLHIHANWHIHRDYLGMRSDEDLIDPEPEQDTLDFASAYCIARCWCPECDKVIIALQRGLAKHTQEDELKFKNENDIEICILYPPYPAKTIFKNIPERVAKDFNEAYSVLNISPKSSAALSRRLLQDILHNHFHIKKKTLEIEIEEFTKRADVSSALISALDLVRTVGNFAAHPKKCSHTGEIVEVEKDEAECLIDTIEMLIDFAFIRPSLEQERREKMQEKYNKPENAQNLKTVK